MYNLYYQEYMKGSKHTATNGLLSDSVIYKCVKRPHLKCMAAQPQLKNIVWLIIMCIAQAHAVEFLIVACLP